MKKVLIICLLLMSPLSKAQNDNKKYQSREGSHSIMDVKARTLLASDHNSLLDRESFKLFADADSDIPTYYWKGCYWFKDRFQHFKMEGNLLCYDSTKGLISKVNEHPIYAGSFIGEIYFFSDYLFLIDRVDLDNLDSLGGKRIIVIDGDKKCVWKDVYLCDSCDVVSSRITEENFIITMQKIKRQYNYFYFLVKYWPHYKDTEYLYSEYGKKWTYVFDRQFNLLETK